MDLFFAAAPEIGTLAGHLPPTAARNQRRQGFEGGPGVRNRTLRFVAQSQAINVNAN
jgi:hypothetical protein